MKSVYRVDVDYYSCDYDDRMLSTSTPYKTEEEAKAAYESACLERCIDDKSLPARVQLTRTDFSDDPTAMGKTSVICQNYKENTET